MNSFFALLSFNTAAGGPGTIDASFRAAESDSPLVVVEDSGKAADLLAFAWHILHDDEKWLVRYIHVHLTSIARVLLGVQIEMSAFLSFWSRIIVSFHQDYGLFAFVWECPLFYLDLSKNLSYRNHGTMEWLATKVQQTFDLPVTSPNIEIFCEKLMSAMENIEKV